MNTFWVLIIIMDPMWNSSTAIVIPNIVSYEECNRVSKLVQIEFPPNDSVKTRCIEVNGK